MSSTASLISSFLTRKRLIGTPQEYKLLSPICSALEVHSYKNALQLCSKLIKKQPDNYIVYALKALTLSLTTRPVPPSAQLEILAAVEFVKTSGNGVGLGDPDVLMFFGWVLDGLGKKEETLSLLAKATSRHPENEDVCVEAFLHYIRAGEKRLAQQISMRMQKSFTSSRYLWWSLMTVILQTRDPLNPSTPLLLSLAERQITHHYTSLLSSPSTPATAVPKIQAGKDKGKGKMIEAGSSEAVVNKGEGKEGKEEERRKRGLEYENGNEFFLVSRFLELWVEQGVRNGAVEGGTPKIPLVLPSLPLPTTTTATITNGTTTDSTGGSLPLTLQQTLLAHFSSAEGERWCSRSVGLELWRREVELKYGGWGKGEERLRRFLLDGDINWHTMLYLIRFTFSSAVGSSSSFCGAGFEVGLGSEEGLKKIGEVKELFKGLIGRGSKERGYYLAGLEIGRLERERGWSSEEGLEVLVEEYFEKFSNTMCCFDDLRNYLEVLSEEERVGLGGRLGGVAKEFEGMTVPGVYRIINAAKIFRFISPVGDEEGEQLAASGFMKQYFEALPLGKGLPVTELQPADDFALLAGQAFVAAWEVSHNKTYLEQALCLLDSACTSSKQKYQLRLLLINLLRLLGASSLSLTHYRLLNLKAIQFDTLSHVVLSRGSNFVLATGVGSDVGIWEEAQNASKWYRVGEHEALEMPVRAFSFHNYTKIEDFTHFQDRLARSVSKFTLKIEIIRLKVLRNGFDPDGNKDLLPDFKYLLHTPKVTLSDNRDYKTLPNLQSQSSALAWEQTQMGPRSQQGWIRAFAFIYAQFLGLNVPLPELESLDTAELTPSEQSLLTFSQLARLALAAPLESVDEETAALEFFKVQDARFTTAVEDAATLPWELLHIAEVALEGYSLLDIAIERRLTDLIDTKVPDHAKLGKKLRTLRTSAKEILKSLGVKANTYGKQVGKQRGKTVISLAPLGEFEAFDEDHLMNFAHSLVESRKGTAEGIASNIHKKCSGK